MLALGTVLVPVYGTQKLDGLRRRLRRRTDRKVRAAGKTHLGLNPWAELGEHTLAHSDTGNGASWAVLYAAVQPCAYSWAYPWGCSGLFESLFASSGFIPVPLHVPFHFLPCTHPLRSYAPRSTFLSERCAATGRDQLIDVTNPRLMGSSG